MVTITATVAEGYQLGYWLVDGTNAGSTNPLQLTLTKHTFVQAVFESVLVVDNFTSDSETVERTLRYAIANAQNGDIIRLDGVTPGETVIELTSRLPNITKTITIEGNGVTITRAATWATTNTTSQMMYINNAAAEVTISQVWFKDGRATSYGGAININAGTVNLESCIFSGNQTTGDYARGGAIYLGSGTLDVNVKGCTFYNNSSSSNGYGGGICLWDGTLTLSGNLFYGNTAGAGPVVYRLSGTATSTSSRGYNVVDAAFGTGSAQSGFAANTTNPDRTLATILGSNTTSPFADISDPANPDLAPVSGLSTATYGIPETWGPANMPATDFYGNARTWPGATGTVR
jgi:hypothetical protein